MDTVDVVELAEDDATSYMPELGIETALEETGKTRTQTAGDHLFGAPLSMVAGFADTVGQSLGLLDENELGNFLQEHGGSLGRYYNKNQDGARFAGDLVGMFIPGMVATKAVRAGSLMHKAVQGSMKSRLANSIFTSGKTAESLMKGVRLSHRYAARVHQRDLSASGMEFIRKGGLGGRGAGPMSLDKFRQRAVNTRMIDNAKEAVAFEIGVAATMNESEALYPEDMTIADYAVWNGLLPAAFVGVERAFMQRSIRKSMVQAGKDQKAFTEGVNSVELPGERSAAYTMNGIKLRALDDQWRLAGEIEDAGKGDSRTRVLRKNLNTEKLAMQKEMGEQLKRMGRDSPIQGVTRQAQLNTPTVNAMVDFTKNDPYLFTGTMSIDVLDEAANAKLYKGKLDTRVEKLMKDSTDTKDVAKAADATAELNKIMDDDPQFFVLENDGTLTVANKRSRIFQDNEKFLQTIKQSKSATLDDTVWTAPTVGKGSMTFNGAGVLEVQGKVKFVDLPVQDQTAAMALVQKAASKWKPGESKRLNLSRDSHFTAFEYAETLIEKYGEDVAMPHIQLPDGVATMQDLKFANLAAKYREYSNIRNRMDRALTGELKLPAGSVPSVHDLQKTLNLPSGYAGEIHPLIDVFEQFRMQGDTDLYKAVGDLDQLQGMMQATDAWGIAAEGIERSLDVRGMMHNYKDGLQPVVLTKRNMSQDVYSGRGQSEILSTITAKKVNTLLSASKVGGDLVETLAKYMASTDSPIRNVDELTDGSLGSTILTQQAFAARESAPIQAAHTLQEITDRMMREHSSAMFNKHGMTFSRLRDTKNAEDMRMLDTFIHAIRQGWDVADDLGEVAEGRMGFVLQNTPKNQKLYRQRFGVDMEEGAFMPVPFGKEARPLVLTDLAMEGAAALREIGEDVYNNINALRTANSGRPLRKRGWWVPPVNFARKDVVHLVDNSGKYLRTIAGSNYSDALRRAQEELDVMSKENKFAMIVDQSNIERYHNLQDEAFENMADFSDVMAQTGSVTGRSVGSEVTLTGASLNEAIESLNRSYESISRRTRITMLENEVKKVRMQVEALPGKGKTQGKAIGDTVQQQWLAAVYGNPTMNPNDIVGRNYYAIESMYDQALDFIWRKKAALSDTKIAKAGAQSEAEKQFEKLNQKLGDDFNPFSSAVEMLEREHKVVTPPSMKSNMAKLNGLLATTTLRFMETGHATLNLVSLAATAPPVVKALTRKPGQSVDDWLESIGAWGSALDDTVAEFDGVRATVSGIHHMFTPEGKAAIDLAKKMGLMKQEVAEIMQTLHNPMEGTTTRAVREAVKKLSFLSDKSEELSRIIAFSIGHKLARDTLKIGKEANRVAFAHRLANDVIGDYRSVNRPKIFQGAVGMPLGLFQTFTWNFYQRVFKYIENKDHRALAVQYAAQASVFGGESVPGFDLFNNFLFSNYDGSENPAEKMRRLYGDSMTDFLLYGSLSNLPKMFGQDGIALYQRGDLNVQRVPGLWSLDKTPAYRFFQTRYEMGKQLVQAARNDNLTTQRIAEIVSINAMNRSMRNIAELYTGVSLTRNNEIVDEDTREFWDIATRLAGMRTMREAKLREAIYKNKSAQYAHTAKREQLADNMRSAFRHGNVSGEQIEKALQLYMATGGSVENFAGYLQHQATVGLVSRPARDITKWLDNPAKGDELFRMMSAFGMPENDPYFE